MSNSYAMLIYGCPLASKPRPSGLALLARSSDVGFHYTYDSCQDYYWFGYQFGGADNGFSTYEPASPDLMAEVDAAWAGLPEELQKSLGKPRILILAGSG